MSQTWTIDEINSATTSPSSDISKLVAGHDANRSNFSGESDPDSSVAYQIYANTTDGVFKKRDSTNATWGILASASNSPVVSISSDYTATISNYDGMLLVSAESADVAITLPAAATVGNGWRMTIKKTDSTDNEVNIESSNSIDGVSTATISEINNAIGVRSTGSTYVIESGTTSSSAPIPPPDIDPGDGNLVLLRQFNVSAVTAIDINNLITTSYNDYVIRFNLTTTDSVATIFMRTSTNNGGSTVRSGYSYTSYYINANNTEFPGDITATEQWVITDVSGGGSAYSTIADIKLYNMLDTSKHKIIQWTIDQTNSLSLLSAVGGSGKLTSLVNMNALSILINQGTMTGTVDFFGVEIL